MAITIATTIDIDPSSILSQNGVREWVQIWPSSGPPRSLRGSGFWVRTGPILGPNLVHFGVPTISGTPKIWGSRFLGTPKICPNLVQNHQNLPPARYGKMGKMGEKCARTVDLFLPFWGPTCIAQFGDFWQNHQIDTYTPTPKSLPFGLTSGHTFLHFGGPRIYPILATSGPILPVPSLAKLGPLVQNLAIVGTPKNGEMGEKCARTVDQIYPILGSTCNAQFGDFGPILGSRRDRGPQNLGVQILVDPQIWSKTPKLIHTRGPQNRYPVNMLSRYTFTPF